MVCPEVEKMLTNGCNVFLQKFPGQRLVVNLLLFRLTHFLVLSSLSCNHRQVLLLLLVAIKQRGNYEVLDQLEMQLENRSVNLRGRQHPQQGRENLRVGLIVLHAVRMLAP